MTIDPLVQQFISRSEEAVAEAKRRYGSGLRALALRILGSPEDAEEIENDTYLEAWNRIPPAEPDSLKSYLYMICRRRAELNRIAAARRTEKSLEIADRLLKALEEKYGPGKAPDYYLGMEISSGGYLEILIAPAKDDRELGERIGEIVSLLGFREGYGFTIGEAPN